MTPEYTDADQQRDMARGSDDPDPGARDSLHRIFGAGVEDERGTADPSAARGAARLMRDKSGTDEKGSAA